jgi:hypothetical protein
LVQDKVLELPLTTVFAGSLRGAGDVIFGRWFGSEAARSMLARAAMLERIALTPEGIPVNKAIEGIDLALDEGVQILNLSFHSPSRAPGHTPYVRTADQLEVFYQWWNIIFRHLKEKDVRPTTMGEIKSISRFCRAT